MRQSREGVSWTLDRAIAEKFALSGGGRGVYSGGVIREQKLDRSRVLAYLTGRNESEVIYDYQTT